MLESPSASTSVLSLPLVLRQEFFFSSNSTNSTVKVIMRDTPTKSMPPAENFPNGNLTVKEGELDVEAKVKECCSNTRNLSVAAHQPTRVVAESLKVRTLDYNEYVIPERFFNPDHATLTNSTQAQESLRLYLQRV